MKTPILKSRLHSTYLCKKNKTYEKKRQVVLLTQTCQRYKATPHATTRRHTGDIETLGKNKYQEAGEVL